MIQTTASDGKCSASHICPELSTRGTRNAEGLRRKRVYNALDLDFSSKPAQF